MADFSPGDPGFLALLRICSFIFAAALVVFIISRGVRYGMRLHDSDVSAGRMSPSHFDGPGTFIVHGVDRATKMDTTWHVAADSEENAKIKGELEGIIVSRVERLEPEKPKIKWDVRGF